MPDAVIGYVTGGWERTEFASSVLAVCMEGKTRIRTVLKLESGPNISTPRNLVVAEFLEKNLAPWVFMADTDMVFPPATIDRRIAAGKPVIGGLCYSLAAGEKLPTMYELTEDDGRLAFRRYGTWPEDTVMKVSATGAACLLAHRDALLEVEKTSKDPAAPWFRESA